jgi:hypothetical protein
MRETPGQLSSLDLVPEAGRNAVAAAMEQLNARNRTQADILFELNDALQAVGCERISKSAFNRAAVRSWLAKQRMLESTAVFAALKPSVTPDTVAEADIIIGEMIKTAASVVLDQDKLTSEDIANLSMALKRVVEAQTLSAELRRAAKAEIDEKLGKAADAVSKAKGITAETRDRIMEQLGVIRAKVA